MERPGSAELLRLELANWLLGTATMQVLMAQTTAADADVDPVRITQAAGLLSGASCDHDNHTVLIASHLAALLKAGSTSVSGTAAGYPGQVRQTAEGLREPPRYSRRSLPGPATPAGKGSHRRIG